MADNMNIAEFAEFVANQRADANRRVVDRANLDSEIRRSQIRRKPKFTVAEDECICKNYISSIEETALGNALHLETLWQMIYRKFQEQTMNLNNRDVSELIQCFSIINKEVTRFVTLFHQEGPNLRNGESKMEFQQRCRADGATMIELRGSGRAEYRRIYEKDFQFENCFEILKYLPKYCPIFMF